MTSIKYIDGEPYFSKRYIQCFAALMGLMSGGIGAWTVAVFGGLIK